MKRLTVERSVLEGNKKNIFFSNKIIISKEIVTKQTETRQCKYHCLQY